MTKSPRFGQGLRLAKLCRWLFLLAAVKLGVLVFLFVDMPTGGLVPQLPELSATVETAALEMAEPDAGQQVSVPRPTLGPGAAAAAETGMPAVQPVPAASAPLTSESLLRRQEELNQREQDLLQLESQIDTKLTELQNLEQRIQSMLDEADATRDAKLRHLVDVYSNMKARQAAGVLETLDEKVAVKILANMRGRQAGEILGYVSPEKAARLSEALTRVQMPLDY